MPGSIRGFGISKSGLLSLTLSQERIDAGLIAFRDKYDA
jgi:hypothetical protein